MNKFLRISLVVLAVGAAAGFVFWHFSNPSERSAMMAPATPSATSTGAEFRNNLADLLNIVQTQDPRAALAELTKRMQTNTTVFKNCHVMAHAIGRAAYKKYQDFDKGLEYQDTTCSDGYLHGLIEAKFSSIQDTDKAIAAAKTICDGYTFKDRCWHGIGHGLMFFTSNDLPKALGICDTYPSSRARDRCYEGAFMENFLSDPDAHPSKYVNAQDPFAPCRAEPGKYKATCYFYVPIYYLGLHDNDYEAAVKWCNDADGYGLSCLRGVGSLAMKYNEKDPKKAEHICQEASNAAGVASCVDGMMGYYLTFTGNLGTMARLCPKLSDGDVRVCEAAVKKNVGLFQD
jgi:hypothetical protein